MTTKIAILLASVRDVRRGEAFARWVHQLLSARSDAHAAIVDLKEWSFPAYLEPVPGIPAEKAYPEGSLGRRWHDLVAGFDAFVIVTPEYNHGYPGNLKNALDQVYAPWTYKPVAFVSYGGTASGTRAVEQLRGVAIELRMIPVRDEVNIRLIELQKDESGFPSQPFYQERAKLMIDETIWLANVMRDGREKNPR